MKRCVIIAGAVVGLLAAAALGGQAEAQGTWECPKEASAKVNPIPYTPQAVAAGKQVAEAKACTTCHGRDGTGNGPGAAGLNPKPANWTEAAAQEDTDGCLFWKITEGRGPMPKWGPMSNENERWELVNYIRSFKKN
jgi:mono/diheme cytochrome c family protein